MVLIFCCLFALASCKNSQKGGEYYDSKKIAEPDSFSTYDCSSNVSDSGKAYTCSFGKLDGFFEVARAEVSNNCFASIRGSIDLERGKLNVVLINSKSECEVLKELDSSQESRFDGDLSINCLNGINKIKIVGYDCEGIVNLSQNEEMIFRFSGDDQDNLCEFPDDFPFSEEFSDLV